MGWHYKTASKGMALLNKDDSCKSKSMKQNRPKSQWKSESDNKPIYYNEDPAKMPPISGIIDQRREYVNQVRFENYESLNFQIYF